VTALKLICSGVLTTAGLLILGAPAQIVVGVALLVAAWVVFLWAVTP
jgi:hypothetical protein